MDRNLLQRFVSYFFKFFAALNFHNGRWPLALAIGYGFLLGGMPVESGLMYWLLLAVACFLPMNHLVMIVLALASHLLEPTILPLQLKLGAWLLETPLLYNLFRLLDNIPLLPWLQLNHSNILGSLMLGLILGTLLGLLAFIVLPFILIRGRLLLIHIKWDAYLQKLGKSLEGQLPQISSLFQSAKFQEWQNSYLEAKEALALAEKAHKELKQREYQRPDFY